MNEFVDNREDQSLLLILWYNRNRATIDFLSFPVWHHGNVGKGEGGTISSCERLAYPSCQSRPQMISLYSKAMSLRAKYKDVLIVWTRYWPETAGWWHRGPCQPFSDDFVVVSTACARFEPGSWTQLSTLLRSSETPQQREGIIFLLPFSPHSEYLLPKLYPPWQKKVYCDNATPTSGCYFAVGPTGMRQRCLFTWVAGWVKSESLLGFTKITVTN